MERKNKYNTENIKEMLSKRYPQGFDFSKLVYTSLETPVIITCNVHGDFTRVARTVLHTTLVCSKCRVEKNREIAKEKFLQEALTFSHYGEFCKSPIYSSCCLYGIDDVIKESLPPNPYLPRTKRIIYSYEFSNHSVYVGLTCRPKTRYQEHITNSNTSVGKLLRANPELSFEYKELHGPIMSSEAGYWENKYINQYKELGWDVINKYKAGSLGKTQVVWTKEEAKIYADKCYYREELHRKFPKAYSVIQRNRWYDLYDHMPMAPLNGRARSIVCLDTGVVYESASQAGRMLLGSTRKGLNLATSARTGLKAYGQKWKYLSDLTDDEKRSIIVEWSYTPVDQRKPGELY